jgi:integrase
MLLIGEHPKIVQERLGHSDISMTLNRYSHVTPGMQKRAADNLSSALNGPTIA